MSFYRTLGCAVLGAALVVGCDKPEESKPPTPPGSVPEPTARKAADDAAAGMRQAAGDAGAAAESAQQEVAETVKETGDEASAAADAAAADANAGAAGTADAANANAAAAGDQATEAQKLIEQATQYIKENKWDLAETTVTKLEGMKASLPENLQPQVANLRKMLDAGKAAAGTGIKLPGQ